MVTDPLADKVRGLIAVQARRATEDLDLDTTLDSLGLDSLNRVELVFAIEEAFDIAVPFNAQSEVDPGFDLTSVGSVVAAVRVLMTAGTP